MSKTDQIRSMLQDDPTDTFLRYALAMELDKEGQHDESIALFEQLMQDDPPYVPAFFMLGQQLARLERLDQARTALRNGIAQARSQNDMHAAGEMGEFLVSIGGSGE